MVIEPFEQLVPAATEPIKVRAPWLHMDQVVPLAPQTIAPLLEHAWPLVAVPEPPALGAMLLAAGGIVLVACALVLVVRVGEEEAIDEAAVATAGAVVLVVEVATAAGTEVPEPDVPDDPDDPLVEELLEDPALRKAADPVQVNPVPLTPPTT